MKKLNPRTRDVAIDPVGRGFVQPQILIFVNNIAVIYSEYGAKILNLQLGMTKKNVLSSFFLLEAKGTEVIWDGTSRFDQTI